MHAVPVARKALLGALLALALIAGALLTTAPKAAASMSQCNEAGRVCVWALSGWEGNFSWWGAGTGCHDHVENSNLRSVYNRTSHSINIVGRGSVAPNTAISLTAGEPSITSQICT
jgi:peptidase inhibitor family I36